MKHFLACGSISNPKPKPNDALWHRFVEFLVLNLGFGRLEFDRKIGVHLFWGGHVKSVKFVVILLSVLIIRFSEF